MLANKGSYSQSYDFSSSHVQMWELDQKEGWALKNWCFQTVVLEKTLESPLIARGSNQSILKEINSECSLEVLMLKLKLQYFGHLMGRANSLERSLMLRKIGDDRGWVGWMASLTQWTWVCANSRSWWRTGKPGVLQSVGSRRVEHSLVTEQQQCLPYTLLSGSWSRKDCWLSTRVLGCGRVPQAKSCEHAVLSRYQVPSWLCLPVFLLWYLQGAVSWSCSVYSGYRWVDWSPVGSFPAVLEAELLDQTEITVV